MSQTIILAALTVVLAGGCGGLCKPQAQRCMDGVAQLCDSAGKWRPVMDCKKISTSYATKWKCYCIPDGKCSCGKVE